MRIDIVTIFPEFFEGPFGCGIVRRAREAGKTEVRIHDLRVFTHDRHKTVDDRPFGGGEGMVFRPEPVFECVESLGIPARPTRSETESVVLLSAQGQKFVQAGAVRLAGLDRLVLICGRYEGVDERVSEFLADRELSIGDYVLSGGEAAAVVVVEAIVRLLPGVLGNEDSSRFESFGIASGEGSGRIPQSTWGPGGLLDYPHYTRPADFRGMKVPEVLVGGNHEQIRRWRRSRALAKTRRNRPDLLEAISLTPQDRRVLEELESSPELEP